MIFVSAEISLVMDDAVGADAVISPGRPAPRRIGCRLPISVLSSSGTDAGER